MIPIVSVFLIFNERFQNLFSYDIYYRLLPIIRLFNGLNIHHLFLGAGTGNFGVIFYSIQDHYPVLELMLPKEVFTYAHNFLIDRLVSAGIGVFLIYVIFYIFIIIKYIKLNEKNQYIQAFFHAFCIGLFMSFYDIVHNTISGYSIFTLITGLLLINIFQIKLKINKYFLLTVILILMIPLVFLKFEKNMGSQNDYNKLINLVNVGKVSNKDINKFILDYPHYAEVDSINVYYKFFYDSSKLNDEDFRGAFLTMNKYNKYRSSRLHFSSQFYSLRNLDENLLDVYSDILYRSFILKRVVSPLYDRNNINIQISNDNNLNIRFLSKPCCTVNIPKDMFNQLKYVNTGLSNLKVTEESINFVASNAIYSIDSIDLTRDTDIVKEFLREVNKYSEPLKF